MGFALHNATLLIHTCHVAARPESNDGWNIRVLWWCRNPKLVKAILKSCAVDPEDGAVPLGEKNVVWLHQTGRNGHVARSLLEFF